MTNERSEEVADVVPHGLDAEVELTHYLLGRVAKLEETQHLSLPWRQVRMRWRRRLALFDILDLAEDADHVPAAAKWNRADLDGHSLAIRVEEHALVVRAVRGSDKVPGEDLPRSARFLWCDDGRELAAANVSHELLRGRVQPADDPVLRPASAHQHPLQKRPAEGVRLRPGRIWRRRDSNPRKISTAFLAPRRC